MIMVDEPSAGAYYGSLVASPYGKEFYSSLFEYLDIPKDDESAKRMEVIMPNLIGESLANAVAILKTLNLYYDIQSHFIYSFQDPIFKLGRNPSHAQKHIKQPMFEESWFITIFPIQIQKYG